jgi:hypothetical protein
MRVVLPANWVFAGYGVPPVCTRHGEPAVRGVRTRLQSRAPGWVYALLLLGCLPYLIAVHATRRTVLAQAWPFCARCAALRLRLQVIGALGVGGAIVLFYGSLAATIAAGDESSSLSGVLFVLAILSAIAGLAVLARSGWGVLARAHATEDGAWVEVPNAHRRFAEQATPPAYVQQPQVIQAYPVHPGSFVAPS